VAAVLAGGRVVSDARKVDRVASTIVASVRATGRCSLGLIDQLDAALGAPEPAEVTRAEVDEATKAISDGASDLLTLAAEIDAGREVSPVVVEVVRQTAARLLHVIGVVERMAKACGVGR
jgi:hypothetical protein